MAEIMEQSECFECSKMGGEVTIKRKFEIHRDPGTGEIVRKVAKTFDCNKKLQCGSAHRSGCRVIYDWSKCTYDWVEEEEIVE